MKFAKELDFGKFISMTVNLNQLLITKKEKNTGNGLLIIPQQIFRLKEILKMVRKSVNGSIIILMEK